MNDHLEFPWSLRRGLFVVFLFRGNVCARIITGQCILDFIVPILYSSVRQFITERGFSHKICIFFQRFPFPRKWYYKHSFYPSFQRRKTRNGGNFTPLDTGESVFIEVNQAKHFTNSDDNNHSISTFRVISRTLHSSIDK
jgi:hypothetical protein